MQRPRNPRHFPRMKVRGARRRRQARWQYLLGRIDETSRAASQTASSFGRLVDSFATASADRYIAALAVIDARGKEWPGRVSTD